MPLQDGAVRVDGGVELAVGMEPDRVADGLARFCFCLCLCFARAAARGSFGAQAAQRSTGEQRQAKTTSYRSAMRAVVSVRYPPSGVATTKRAS